MLRSLVALLLFTMSFLHAFTRVRTSHANAAKRYILMRAINNSKDDWVPYQSIDVTKPKISKDVHKESSSLTAESQHQSNRKELSTRSNGSWRNTKPNSPRRDFKRPSGQSRGGDDFKSSNIKPWMTKEKTEPVYGYYDGDHIYGLNPVWSALNSKRRNIKELILQEDLSSNTKKDALVPKIISLANAEGIPIRYFPKHDLNMLSDNRPHQGVIMRATPLKFQKAEPLPKTDTYKVVLALDEVWDPQNFGALLRTSYFLGCDSVVVCGKNSAPLSPVVSKASAGVMEFSPVYSTDNMMKWLDQCKENGWQVVGTDVGEESVPFQSIPLQKPTILVLGNEGHGIRTNILRRCDHLVAIDKRPHSAAIADGADGVDSLNVSVCGGILLHHLLSASTKTS